MVIRYELSDWQWERISALVPGKAGDPGRTGADNRGLPPLTGSKCLVREAVQLGPWKKGVTSCPRSDFPSSRLSTICARPRYFAPEDRPLVRSVVASACRSRAQG